MVWHHEANRVTLKACDNDNNDCKISCDSHHYLSNGSQDGIHREENDLCVCLDFVPLHRHKELISGKIFYRLHIA